MDEKNCQRVCEMLSSYIDEELSKEDCKNLEEHMASCQTCTLFYKKLSTTVKLSRKLECSDCYEMPNDVREKLREFLKKECKCEK
jgi:predicted anti-sigma-YlaC factor YlaD